MINFVNLFAFQDGTFSFEDFATAFDEYDVQRVIRSYENSISINVHCCQEGDWKQVSDNWKINNFSLLNLSVFL